MKTWPNNRLVVSGWTLWPSRQCPKLGKLSWQWLAAASNLTAGLRTPTNCYSWHCRLWNLPRRLTEEGRRLSDRLIWWCCNGWHAGSWLLELLPGCTAECSGGTRGCPVVRDRGTAATKTCNLTAVHSLNSAITLQLWKYITADVTAVLQTGRLGKKRLWLNIYILKGYYGHAWRQIDWARFNIPPNTLQVISRTIFTGHMTKPTVSKHWRKPVGLANKAWIPPWPFHHVTIIQL